MEFPNLMSFLYQLLAISCFETLIKPLIEPLNENLKILEGFFMCTIYAFYNPADAII